MAAKAPWWCLAVRRNECGGFLGPVVHSWSRVSLGGLKFYLFIHGRLRGDLSKLNFLMDDFSTHLCYALFSGLLFMDD